MTIYLISYLISIVIISFAQEKVSNPKKQKALYIIAIVVTSLIVGLRNIGIGIDTKVYAEIAMIYSQKFDYITYMSFFHNSMLFYTLFYVVSMIFNNIHACFFVIEFIIEYLILKVLIDFSNKNKNFKIYIGMLTYYLIFQAYSMNIMRQSIALALILYELYFYIKNKKYFKAIIVNIIAFLFHYSAIIGILIMAIYYIFQVFKNSVNVRSRFVLAYIFFVFFAFFVLFYNEIINILGSWIGEYSKYSEVIGNFNYTINAWVLFAMIYIVAVAIKRLLNNDNKDLKNISSLIVYGYILFFINIYSNDTYRLSFYFLYNLIVYIPYIYINNKNSKNTSRVLFVVQTIIMLVFYYIMFNLWSVNEVIPYQSDVLGIK